MLRISEVQVPDRRRRDRRYPLGAAEGALQPVGREQHPGDLAEAERDDRQVVPAQTQHRCADQEADERRDHHDDRDRDEEGQMEHERRRRVAGRGDA